MASLTRKVVSDKYGYEIVSDQLMLERLWKRLQDLNQKEIQYGYFEESRYATDDNRGAMNLPVATLAWWHENGLGSNVLGPPVQVNYPARPFFTQSIEKAKNIVKEEAPGVFTRIIAGKQEKNMLRIGNRLIETVHDAIDEQNFQALQPKTIADKRREGWPKPEKILEESGTLRNSVEAKIVNSDAYGDRKKEVKI